MAMLLGKKIGMTRLYDEEGNLVPATVVQAGPCVVTQIKTVDTDGYNAVQIGFTDTKPSRQTKPLIGHCAKAGTSPKQFVREIRLGGKEAPAYQLGDSLTVDVFSDTQKVDVVGTSKGKGFAGPMKRHGFGGFPASHGCERKHRAPGSQASHGSNAGGNGGPKRGKRMAGQMGNARVTTKNHCLLAVDTERNLLIVKGAIAGASGNYCVIKSAL
jgi:large subunit ribosomal protein L3